MRRTREVGVATLSWISEVAIVGFGSVYFRRGRALRRSNGFPGDDDDPLLPLVSRSRLECRYHSENNPLRKQLVTRHGVG